MYLLSHTGNWNDEINVDGYIIIDDCNKDLIIQLLENYDDIVYINNGGDDEIEYDNGKELLDEIEFDKITPNECKVIEKFFGKYNDYGYNLILNIDKLDNELNLLENICTSIIK